MYTGDQSFNLHVIRTLKFTNLKQQIAAGGRIQYACLQPSLPLFLCAGRRRAREAG
jgi:hypothetical protein